MPGYDFESRTYETISGMQIIIEATNGIHDSFLIIITKKEVRREEE